MLRGQGQGLQNVSSRSRTSVRTLPLAITTRGEVLEDVYGFEDTFRSPWPRSLQVIENACPRFEYSTNSWFVKTENNQRKLDLNFGFLVVHLFFGDLFFF